MQFKTLTFHKIKLMLRITHPFTPNNILVAYEIFIQFRNWEIASTWSS